MRKLGFLLFQAVDNSILMIISIIMKLLNLSLCTTIKIKRNNLMTVMLNFAIDTLSLLTLFRLLLLSLDINAI